jgi:dihydrofolate synthase / folylpolyglutamate synthase
VDVAVIEVGMGGRWDATNVADGAVAVITPVALDHMQWLGDTVEAIATEKAGIIKPGATAVIAQQPFPEAAEILLQRAALVGATVAREGFEFGVLAREVAVGGQALVLQGLRGTYADVFLPLFGAHQASNAACALAATEAFAGVSEMVSANAGPDEDGRDTITLGPGLSSAGLDAELVRAGFAAVSSPGRLDILRRSPTVIADAAHNPAGMTATLQALNESFSFDRIIGVVAVAEDKDVEGLLEELEPVLAEIVVTTNSSPRAMPAEELAHLARDYFGEDRVQVADRLDAALDLAVSLADDADAEAGVSGSTAVLVTGSVVTAGDAQLLLAPESAVGSSANAGYASRQGDYS